MAVSRTADRVDMTTPQETQQNVMRCIEDGTGLEPSKTSGEPSMRCPVCSGAWISEEAFTAVEDKSFSPDMVKGQMRYGERPTDHPCPHCGENMTRFRYRGRNLEIEACPNHAGYWLDHGEDRHIKDALKDRQRRLQRSVSAQRTWHALRRGGSVSLMDRIRSLFRR